MSRGGACKNFSIAGLLETQSNFEEKCRGFHSVSTNVTIHSVPYASTHMAIMSNRGKQEGAMIKFFFFFFLLVIRDAFCFHQLFLSCLLTFYN